MTSARWDALTEMQRGALRSTAGLSPQLTGLEGWRIEVKTKDGETRRFLVSRSTGWIPCHIELKRITSTGGYGANKEYETVRVLYRQR
jgi:hypothetical protein